MSAEDPRVELGRIVVDLRRHLAERPDPLLRTRRPAATRSEPPMKKTTSFPVDSAGAPPDRPGALPTATEIAAGGVEDGEAPAAEKLARLREHIGDCQRCPLGGTRIRLAFGVGNPEARVMFIGEGPGYAEDRQGEPFVGPAGKLLDKILEATGLSRHPQTPAWKWVYIANMVKCHPMIDPADNTKRGNDRPPTPEEMAVCSPFLMAQIRIIRPLFLVTLGATAGKGLLRLEEGISKFRGRWTDFSPAGAPDLRVRVMPTYHPAALLRNPGLKKDVWEDMKALKSALEQSVAG